MRRYHKVKRVEIEDVSYTYCPSCGQFFDTELEVQVTMTGLVVCRYCYNNDSWKNRVAYRGKPIPLTDIYRELHADPDYKKFVKSNSEIQRKKHIKPEVSELYLGYLGFVNNKKIEARNERKVIEMAEFIGFYKVFSRNGITVTKEYLLENCSNKRIATLYKEACESLDVKPTLELEKCT